MVQNARNFRCFLHRRSQWLEGSKQLPSLGKAWCSWSCVRFALIPTRAFLHQKTCTSFSVSPWCSSLQRSEHWACDTAVHNVNHKLFIAELFLNVKISIQLFLSFSCYRVSHFKRQHYGKPVVSLYNYFEIRKMI